jgi:hypothetical protein
MRRIIGINGKAEAGKDVAAGFVLAVYPNARRVAFADELKLQALAAWDTTEHPYHDLLHLLTDARKIAIADNLKANGAFRTFLQDFGQQKRAEDPEYWIRACFARHERLHGWGHALVIPDMRYKNEFAAVGDARGLRFRVNRPGHENRLTAEQRAHSSETDLDDIDWNYIPNAGIVENPGEPVAYLRNVLAAVRPYMEAAERAVGGF